MITKQYNPAGIYKIRLCNRGIWQVITIDDMLPVTESNTFVFTRSQKKQLFASLIEKALAKMHGSYSALESGKQKSAHFLLKKTSFSSIRSMCRRFTNINRQTMRGTFRTIIRKKQTKLFNSFLYRCFHCIQMIRKSQSILMKSGCKSFTHELKVI